ncbi:hypothetical protein [Streptomyces pseudovenezuelae]|uniref:hypothetical protein n=1 Tax=Streptomyces pseudovenezuelae TaxID=67350 RepID=UPI002E816FA7|nr:hypothetical protein [Streptomyces pseudovenezuelae]WUA94541.1 hypothetical protein OHO81_45020 [Streptomyces pseudovenezuelae]
MSAEAPEATDAAAAEGGSFEVLRADAVLAGRAASAGMFLAGLIADGQLATVGSPSKLPADLFPDVDPAVVDAIWQRALAVGLHAGRVSAAPRLHRDQMDRIAGQFAEVGYVAMGRAVARSRRLVAPELTHPADAEAGRDRPSPV